MTDFTWSKSEKKIAHKAFNTAYERECDAIMQEIRTQALKLRLSDDIWRMHDYLSERRSEINEKYDYRYSMLSIVFPRLIHEGWITFEDLEGLSEDKLNRFRLILRLPD